jgi:hypothetical protein
MVYDEHGTFLRQLGRLGDGPDEYQGGTDIGTMKGDSILVLDRRNGRAVVLTPDLVAKRTISLLRIGPVLRVGDKFVTTGFQPTPANAGWPLHFVSFAGPRVEILRSFGADSAVTDPSAMDRLSRNLAAARSGGFWSADQLQYRVSRWSADGQLIRGLERRPPWFAKPAERSVGNPSTPPNPFVAGLQEEADGLLWVYTNVAAPTWREGWPRMPAGVRELAANQIDISKMLQTIIEVIDPIVGRVVARLETKDYVLATLPGRRSAIYSVDSDGFPRITIREFTLTGR